MRRVLLGLLTATLTFALIGNQFAYAQQVFPGAGYGVSHVSSMTVKFKVPTLSCHAGENSVVVAGLISPLTGTLDGWNAASVTGCYNGGQWSRIQVWVNALGGGHKVASASPGDQIKAQLSNGYTRHPTIRATNETTGESISYPLMKSTTVAAAGTYAGAMVPSFGHLNLLMWANHLPAGRLQKARRTAWRDGTKIMEPGGVWSLQYFTVRFCHH